MVDASEREHGCQTQGVAPKASKTLIRWLALALTIAIHDAQLHAGLAIA
jgi:hypothetical protein